MLRALPVIFLLALPAAAQDLLPDARSVVDEAKSLCDGTVTLGINAVAAPDLNGDGTPDWLVDTGDFHCSTMASLYCGTMGCGVTTIINGIRGDLTLHSWGVVTEGGKTYLTAPNDQGETVRFFWTGTEWAFQG